MIWGRLPGFIHHLAMGMKCLAQGHIFLISFGTDTCRTWQTVQTQIRLLLIRSSLIRVLTVCIFVYYASFGCSALCLNLIMILE